jgi:hypothetical protein
MSLFSSIPIWGWFDIFFNFAVLVALCGEADWALKRLIPKKLNLVPSAEWRRKKLKKKFEWLLIFGIAGEVACLPFSLAESAASNLEAKEAGKEAGDAKVLAANIGTTNAQLVLQIEGLRSKNFALEKEVIELRNPNTITTEQREKFIEILSEPHNASKIPIVVIYAGDNRQTERFAFQVRKVLDEAGYGFVPAKYQLPSVEVQTNALYVETELPHIDLPAFEWNDAKFLIKMKSGSVSPLPESSNSSHAGETYTAVHNSTALLNTEYPFTDSEPNVIALFSGDIPSNGIMPSVNIAYPTPYNPDRGFAYAYAPTKDRNAILYGVCEVFHSLGITVGKNKATGIIPDGSVGFFIPSR